MCGPSIGGGGGHLASCPAADTLRPFASHSSPSPTEPLKCLLFTVLPPYFFFIFHCVRCHTIGRPCPCLPAVTGVSGATYIRAHNTALHTTTQALHAAQASVHSCAFTPRAAAHARLHSYTAAQPAAAVQALRPALPTDRMATLRELYLSKSWDFACQPIGPVQDLLDSGYAWSGSSPCIALRMYRSGAVQGARPCRAL